jgi:hypothetical protein
MSNHIRGSPREVGMIDVWSNFFLPQGGAGSWRLPFTCFVLSKEVAWGMYAHHADCIFALLSVTPRFLVNVSPLSLLCRCHGGQTLR